MKIFLKRAVIGLVVGLWLSVGAAEEVSIDQIKDLDSQVQDFKKEALRIAADISQLEKKLVYPTDTRVSLFVKLGRADGFRPGAVTIKLDGKSVTHYVYSGKELEAMQQGGVQRIYTDNLRTGAHTLDVAIIGKSSGNADLQQNVSHQFVKTAGTKLLEITLSGAGSSIQGIDN